MIDNLPERRQAILQIKIRNTRNAIIIAAGANPIGALLDMTVMVSLQRQVVEEYWVPEVWGDDGLPMLNALRILDREIWQLAQRALNPDAVVALKELIPEIRKRFPDQVHVSAIRASDFAEDRQAAVVRLQGGTSLLQLFQLDPLASLSPASQELAQTRLLAERLFFWMKRVPVMFDWQVEEWMLDVFSEPEVQTFVDSSERLSEASREFSNSVAELSEWLPEERAVAVEQISEQLTSTLDEAINRMSEIMTNERNAAITQMMDGLAAEREAILKTFESEEERLRGLMTETRQTAEAITATNTTLREAVESTNAFIQSLRRDPNDPRPASEARPFDITDYQATADSMTEALSEFNNLVGSMQDLLASPDWTERSAQIQTAAVEGEEKMQRLIDRAFWRGIIVAVVFVAAAFFAAVLYRMIFRANSKSKPTVAV